MSSIRPWRTIERRKCRQIMVGNVPVGGDAPITVQTMTNTPTEDVRATLDQIRRCEEVGADIIRVSCPTEESTRDFKTITRNARMKRLTRARRACASTRAISDQPSALPKWCAPPRPMAARSASA
jgi:GcpE protein